MQPVYMAVFIARHVPVFPKTAFRGRLLAEAVLAFRAREFGIPLSLMIGVRYQVNPTIRLAGDGRGPCGFTRRRTFVHQLPRLIGFLISVLSRGKISMSCACTRESLAI